MPNKNKIAVAIITFFIVFVVLTLCTRIFAATLRITSIKSKQPNKSIIHKTNIITNGDELIYINILLKYGNGSRFACHYTSQNKLPSRYISNGYHFSIYAEDIPKRKSCMAFEIKAINHKKGTDKFALLTDENNHYVGSSPMVNTITLK